MPEGNNQQNNQNDDNKNNNGNQNNNNQQQNNNLGKNLIVDRLILERSASIIRTMLS